MKSDIVYIAELLKTQDHDIWVNTVKPTRILAAEPFLKGAKRYKEHVLYICSGESFEFPEDCSDTISVLFCGSRVSNINIPAERRNQMNYIVSFADLPLSAVADAVEQINIFNGRYAGIMDSLINALARGEGLQCIVDYGYKLFGNPLTIFDLSYKLLAASADYTSPNPYYRKTRETQYLQPKSIEAAKRTHRFEKIINSSAPNYINLLIEEDDEDIQSHQYGAWDIGIQIHGITVAFLSISGILAPFSVFTKDWLVSISKLASIELQKNEEFINSSGFGYEIFLTALLDRKLTDSALANWRMHALGIKVSRYLCVLTVCHSDQSLREMGIPHILQSQLRSFFPKCMSLRYRGDIVLLISSEAEQLSLPEKTEADFLRFLKSNSLCCGISNVFTSVVQMPDFYYQTEIAIIYGSRLSKNHLIYQYNEYAIFHVFSSCTESISLRELCHPGVLHLWESHKESDKELLRTLYLYLFHMKNVNKVCTELHIHRNTLFYRLNRVKSIIKDEIDNSASLFRILLSFELIKYYAMDTQAGDPFLFPFL